MGSPVSPGQASPSPRATPNPHRSAHTLWEVGQLSEQSYRLGRPQASARDPEPLLASHRIGDQGQAELQRYVAAPGWRGPALSSGGGGGQVDSPPLLPPEGQSPRKPAKLLQVMRLRQALSATVSQQQGTLPSVSSGVESER